MGAACHQAQSNATATKSQENTSANLMNADDEKSTIDPIEIDNLANNGPFYMKESMLDNCVEYIYQFPASNHEKWKGIIVICHGACHGSPDWWNKSQFVDSNIYIDTNTDSTSENKSNSNMNAMKKCIGLPHERVIVKSFLDSNYIVLTISSQDRERFKGWVYKNDFVYVKNTILNFRTKYKLNKNILPLFVVGISSGGRFAGLLAENKQFIKDVGLKGVIIQIMTIEESCLENINIPIMFDYMLKDSYSCKFIASINIDDKKQKNVRSKKIKGVAKIVKTQIVEKKVDEMFFYDNIDNSGMTKELSKLIYDALKSSNLLNDKDYLKSDPAYSSWRQALKSEDNLHLKIKKQIGDELVADQSPISELLRSAFAIHEISSQNVQQMVSFCDMCTAS